MVSLLEAPKHRNLRVVKVTGGRGVRVNLARMQIHVGSEVKILRNAPFSGPLMVERNGAQTALGRGIAGKIFVEEVE